MNQHSRYGFAKLDKGIVHRYLCLPDFTYAELAVYSYMISTVQNNKGQRGKNGYCYRTKSRMSSDLKMSRNKLNKSIEILRKYALIEGREIPNYRGGHSLEEFTPMNLMSTMDFLESFGHLLKDNDYKFFANTAPKG